MIPVLRLFARFCRLNIFGFLVELGIRSLVQPELQF